MPAKKKKTAKKKTTRKKCVRRKCGKKKDKLVIKKDMTISEVVAKHPEAIEVFLEHGMGCFGCGAAQFETVEQGAQAHGINVKKLIDALNKSAKKK